MDSTVLNEDNDPQSAITEQRLVFAFSTRPRTPEKMPSEDTERQPGKRLLYFCQSANYQTSNVILSDCDGFKELRGCKSVFLRNYTTHFSRTGVDIL